jgi:phosphoribosylformylglycinamidine synthase
MHLVAHPNIASRKWVYEQYDSMVGTINKNINKISDAAIVNLKGTCKALAMTVDCNSRYVYADPEKGASVAVAEAARTIVCSGGIPLAITNCLNFGNPYHPEVYWQFVHAIKGMSAACKKFNTPVTGGNVSFYNQTVKEGFEQPVYPTPTIGMIGILEDKRLHTGLGFTQPGDRICLIGKPRNDISSSQYLVSSYKSIPSPAPFIDLEEELLVQQCLQRAIRSGLIASAHDVSDGGLFVSLTESALPERLGFSVNTDPKIRKDAFLFGESQSRIVVSVKPEQVLRLENMLKADAVDFSFIGHVTEENITVDGEQFGTIKEMAEIYENSLGTYLS